MRWPAQDIIKKLDHLWKHRAGTQITLHTQKNTLLWNSKIKSLILMVKNNTEEYNEGINVTKWSKTITLNGKGTVPLLIMTIVLFCLCVLMGTGTRYLELFQWKKVTLPTIDPECKKGCPWAFAMATPYLASCNEVKMLLFIQAMLQDNFS